MTALHTDAPDRQVDESQPRWVLAADGPGPLEGRAISWSDQLATLAPAAEARRDSGIKYQIVQVVGPAARSFPLQDEMPHYWKSLNPADTYVGELAPHLEVYRRGSDLLIVDDSGPGSPELVGSLPAALGARPVDPDDAGVAEDDPLWIEMSDRLGEWLDGVAASSLNVALAAMGAWSGWAFIELLRTGGFDPGASGTPELWIAEKAFDLTA